nr:hypothetical protein [Tanacetum cinerariifolium]
QLVVVVLVDALGPKLVLEFAPVYLNLIFSLLHFTWSLTCVCSVVIGFLFDPLTPLPIDPLAPPLNPVVSLPHDPLAPPDPPTPLPIDPLAPPFKDTSLGGERSITGVDCGGAQEDAIGTVTMETTSASTLNSSLKKESRLNLVHPQETETHELYLRMRHHVVTQRANSDCAACSSVAIAFPLPSTTWSGRVASATDSRIATPPTCKGEDIDCFAGVTLGFGVGVGLLDFSLAGFDLSCLVVTDQLVGNWHSKDFIFFSFGNEFEITKDCSCSKGSVEDKILVPKPPKNCARCTKCGLPVNGPYCQGCALLRERLEEDLVSYFQNFQNTSESSDDSTNVVNALREPFVGKLDHGVKSSWE